MARMRIATVEYRRCEPCALDYTGPHCPRCRHPTSVLTPRLTRSLLIVVDPACPDFVREERWRCRSCEALYVPPAIAPIVARAARCTCGATLFDRAALADIFAGATTPLAQAQRVVAAIKRRKRCRTCGAALAPPCWCPICAATQLATSSILPLRSTWVYVPTGNAATELTDRIADQTPDPRDPTPDDDAIATDPTADMASDSPAPARED
ncbi:hypothetical protein [Thiocapsa marina]|uniref:Uncharacterized protein n=1 Tax=Thiocapsa marina 5811 TaxID=768671 RepID=F9UHQ8_9GAMM|nr:hypothetical protein [Thiocapsa marina]EGV16234.1 hypothetical protein ThimaDRAFT_4461 [Thiocapsa marina 5811]